MNKILNSLKVLRSLEGDKVFASMLEYFSEKDVYTLNDFVSEIYSAQAESNLSEYIGNLILNDENAFSTGCAVNGGASAYVEEAFVSDLKIIFSLLSSLGDNNQFNTGELPEKLCGNDFYKIISGLKEFYANNGYGKFIQSRAFRYENGIRAIEHPSGITLDKLKNYEEEKKLIENNVSYFLNGLPYSHMLLYGDRGTGKSSTVHAILNKYCSKGLRLIEVGKEDLNKINAIKQEISLLPLKFIIFIDDLSINEQDDITSSLKASVEGSISAGNNSMIVATSNRRHVIKESFSDRDNSIHPSDSIEEQLSLSDRFALTVMFSSTDKDEYISIVNQLADDFKLSTKKQELAALAERWAIIKGGRSPRRAKQFIDFVYSCEKSQRKIEF